MQPIACQMGRIRSYLPMVHCIGEISFGDLSSEGSSSRFLVAIFLEDDPRGEKNVNANLSRHRLFATHFLSDE